MVEMKCPSCGRVYELGEEACRSCGFVFPFSTSILAAGIVLRGRYEIQRLLHTGGMGYVYLAKDKNLYDRVCVVKQVRDRVQSQEHRAKLEEEGLRMSRLHHQNVAMILDQFVEFGYYFLVVEHVEGKTLSEVFEERRGRIEEGEVVRWGVTMCEVLRYLHGEGVIHRDISPDNVMLTGEGVIKFIDFGTLRELRNVASGGTAGMGKFGFTPPEQWSGLVEPRSDIFALGSTLYYLLTGYLPLTKEYLGGQSPQSGDFNPDYPPVREKNPGVTVQLEAMLQKALQLEVSKRYGTVGEMKRGLEQLLHAKTWRITPKTKGEKAASGARMYLVAAVVILVLGAIGVGAYLLLGGGSKTPSQSNLKPGAGMSQTFISTAATFLANDNPTGICFDGLDIWVANSANDTVTKLRASDGAILGSYAVGSHPMFLCSEGNYIWVSNGGSNSVTRLRASDGANLGTFPVGIKPSGICSDGDNVWVVNNIGDNVTKLRASDGALLGTYAAGDEPYGICFDGTSIWITNYGSSSVTRIRARDGDVLGTYLLDFKPANICSDGNDVWITCVEGSSVTRLRADDGFMMGPYTVGSHPFGICFDGGDIWVTHANYENDNIVTRLKASDGTVRGTYTVGKTPLGICFDGDNVWVSNADSDSVTKLVIKQTSSTKSPTTASTPSATSPLNAIAYLVDSQPAGICFDGTDIWVATLNWRLNKLRTVDGAIMGTFQVNPNAFDICFDGTNIWVPSGNANNIKQVRTSDGTILATYTLGKEPLDLCFDGSNIWVNNSGSDTVTKLRVSDGVILGTYAAGDSPTGICFDGTSIWVTNRDRSSVTRLKPSDGTILGIFTVGLEPANLCFDGNNIWVTNNGGNTVTKLRASDGVNLGTYPVGNGPLGIAFDGSDIWVTNRTDNTVTRLRARDGSNLGSFPVGREPFGICFDGNNLWVTNTGSDSVTKLIIKPIPTPTLSVSPTSKPTATTKAPMTPTPTATTPPTTTPTVVPVPTTTPPSTTTPSPTTPLPTTTPPPTTVPPTTTTPATSPSVSRLYLRGTTNIASFDPYFGLQMNINSAWTERLFTDNWALDPAEFDFKTYFRPGEYIKGQLADTWEFTDFSTLTIHLRQGIKWQNKLPVNGREFTAQDVAYHYHRLFGGGDGFSAPAPYWGTVPEYKYLMSVTATDRYTVTFRWSISSPEFILETMQALGPEHLIAAREVVEQYGNLQDWRNAVGTGPFILTDFASGSSANVVKNSDYWGFDERDPQNRLPYVDRISYLIIGDKSTAFAALRTGKIDALDGVNWQDAQSIQNTNPEIIKIDIPSSTTLTLDLRNDTLPFNNIKIRKAMQLAIDLTTIASAFYGGTANPISSSLTAEELSKWGWGWSYSQWPPDLKAEYSFNLSAAKQLMAEAGYPNGFKTNVIASTAADLDLLNIVQFNLASIGINMEIRLMDMVAWNSYIQNRQHTQMVFNASGALGLGYEPIKQLQQFRACYVTNWLMVNDPVFDSFYKNALAATSSLEVKQIVRTANEYVARQHYAISLLKPKTYALHLPRLKGYAGQNNSISGGQYGPGLLGFYAARFRIN